MASMYFDSDESRAARGCYSGTVGPLALGERLETLSNLQPRGNMPRPQMMVELCAGLASVSLALQGGRYCRPPVSRMGNKHGYSSAILRVLGLRPGQGADAFLWCEPDDGCRALLQAYPQPEVLRAAADIIRGWAKEPPRELWERLRAEGPIRGAEGREVARWVLVTQWSRPGAKQGSEGWYGPGATSGGTWGQEARDNAISCDRFSRLIATRITQQWPPVTITNDARTIDPREVARWAWVQRRSAHAKGDGFHSGNDTHKISSDAPAPCLAALPPSWPPVTITNDARTIDPREVARWLTVNGWAYAATGLLDPAKCGIGNIDSKGRHWGVSDQAWIAGRIGVIPLSWPPVTVTNDARAIDPPELQGVVVYMDPPYQGTTGYGNELPRADVLDLARRWGDAGATVCVSEAEPLELEGWHHVEITGERVGQKRTFSKQQTEWLTLNRKPAWVPAQQGALFGAL